MESVEASGKSIEDAILQALARLGRNRDEVDIVVLQQPSRGSRGMGAREARVRATVRVPQGYTAPRGPMVAQGYDGDAGFGDEADLADGYGDEYDQEYAGQPNGSGDGAAPAYAPSELTVAALRDLLPEDASIEEFAVTALETILGHMGVRGATVEVEDTPEDEPLILNIVPRGHGSLSFLIGRRGETLAALQLLVNLVTSKQTGERERIIVDVQGYRQRREDNLRTMAERIAQQVRSSGVPMVLEAMPPNERRIIHMALADYDDISTESTGEGDQRRVVVALKHTGRTAPA